MFEVGIICGIKVFLTLKEKNYVNVDVLYHAIFNIFFTSF